MRASEFVTETAHHSRMYTAPVGKWNVHIDTHQIVTAAARNIPASVASNIIRYAFTKVPDIETIPRGKGAFFQDTNTLISIYIFRSKNYPNEFTVETILSPEMKISPPYFRAAVPPTGLTDPPGVQAGQEFIRQQVQARGRDAVSQDMELMKPKFDAYLKRQEKIQDMLDAYPHPTNRAERRALVKHLSKRIRTEK